jgi:hypothetical protein
MTCSGRGRGRGCVRGRRPPASLASVMEAGESVMEAGSCRRSKERGGGRAPIAGCSGAARAAAPHRQHALGQHQARQQQAALDHHLHLWWVQSGAMGAVGAEPGAMQAMAAHAQPVGSWACPGRRCDGGSVIVLAPAAGVQHAPGKLLRGPARCALRWLRLIARTLSRGVLAGTTACSTSVTLATTALVTFTATFLASCRAPVNMSCRRRRRAVGAVSGASAGGPTDASACNMRARIRLTGSCGAMPAARQT